MVWKHLALNVDSSLWNFLAIIWGRLCVSRWEQSNLASHVQQSALLLLVSQFCFFTKDSWCCYGSRSFSRVFGAAWLHVHGSSWLTFLKSALLRTESKKEEKKEKKALGKKEMMEAATLGKKNKDALYWIDVSFHMPFSWVFWLGTRKPKNKAKPWKLR